MFDSGRTGRPVEQYRQTVFRAQVLQVLIASPSDATTAREAAVEAIVEWNASRSEQAGVVLLARRWEVDSVPMLDAGGPQSVINEQLVKDCDIVLAMFASRFGTPTKRAASGTAEEIGHAHQAGKPVHVWFSQAPRPHDADREQLAALDDFRAEIGKLGLLGTFDSSDDLIRKATRALERDVQSLALTASADTQATPDGPPDLRVRWEHLGKQSRVVVRNADSERTAYALRLEMEPTSGGEAPLMLHADGEPPTLQPGDEFAFIAIAFMGTPMNLRAVMTVDDAEGNPLEPVVRSFSRA